MRAICLTLDRRLDYYQEYIQPEFKRRLGIDVERFLVGCGETLNPNLGISSLALFECRLNYDYIDDPYTLPIKYDKSTKYPTWFKTPNAYNAWKAHNAIFRKVINSADPYFLLLEDDVVIEDDFEQILGDNLDELMKVYDFDMLQLGSYNATKRGHAITPNLLELPRNSDVGGFHAVILKRNVIQRLLELPPYGPYDWMASTYIHGNLFRCLAVTPSVITQKSGWSFVEQRNLEKPDRTI